MAVTKRGFTMAWTVTLPNGAAWYIGPGQWHASNPADREAIRARLRSSDYISALPLCPEFSTAEPLSPEAFAAVLVAEFGEVVLPPDLAERVVPSIPPGAVS